MRPFITPALLFLLAACNARPAADDATAAANALTRHYQQQKLKASVAGEDCRTLLIEAATRLDEATVESIHYGVAGYEAYGGVERFAEERDFLAVVYRDERGAFWTYGAVTLKDAESLRRCE